MIFNEFNSCLLISAHRFAAPWTHGLHYYRPSDPHGKDCSYNPIAFPPSMEVRRGECGKCKEQFSAMDMWLPGYSLITSLSIVLFLFMTPLNAEVLVNNIEKNDKVVVGVIWEQQDSSKPPAQPVEKKTANNALKYHALYAEQWEISRSGESILSIPVLKQIINSWLDDRQKKIEIQYPGGEEGEFWVHELTDWLVSLGIPSGHIVVVPGSGADDVINLALIK